MGSRVGPGSRVLVTGASGLVGSWLVEALNQRGATVTALIRDWVPDSRLIGGGEAARTNVVRGELRDRTILERAIHDYEIDTVFHLGAQTQVRTANRCPLQTFEDNVRGTWNLLEACRHAEQIDRVVVASSDKAYGIHEELPYQEDAPLQGRFPYDVSKSCADLIAQSYAASYALPIVIGRCGNIYGGGDLNFDRLIPGTIRSVLRDERPIIRSDGTFQRDYVYVEDAVDAYLRMADAVPGEIEPGEAFNFGDGRPVSVLDLVNQILALMERADLEPRILDLADREIPHQYLDSAKARRVLDWQPAHSLAAGLDKTVPWYRQHLAEHP